MQFTSIHEYNNIRLNKGCNRCGASCSTLIDNQIWHLIEIDWGIYTSLCLVLFNAYHSLSLFDRCKYIYCNDVKQRVYEFSCSILSAQTSSNATLNGNLSRNTDDETGTISRKNSV